MDRRAESVEDRVARLESLLESTMKQVGFLTGALHDLMASVEEELATETPQTGIIVPMRRN